MSISMPTNSCRTKPDLCIIVFGVRQEGATAFPFLKRGQAGNLHDH
jgi:hypothetical protein